MNAHPRDPNIDEEMNVFAFVLGDENKITMPLGTLGGWKQCNIKRYSGISGYSSYFNGEILKPTDYFMNWNVDSSIIYYKNKNYILVSTSRPSTDNNAIKYNGSPQPYEQCLSLQEIYFDTNDDIITTGPTSIISCPTLQWERTQGNSPIQGDHSKGMGINEGPFFFIGPKGHNFIVYSANFSIEPYYCLGLLYTSPNADITIPSSWSKLPSPIFVSNHITHPNSPYGPGGFCKLSFNCKHYFFYHCSLNFVQYSGNRVCMCQEMTFNSQGFPILGGCITKPGTNLTIGSVLENGNTCYPK